MNDTAIPITNIIEIDNPEEFKLHVASWNGYEQPLDVYVQNPEEWDEWNTYSHGGNDTHSRKYILSLINFHHETYVWLFGGVYEIISRRQTSDGWRYETKKLEGHSKYVGRLKIMLEYASRQRSLCLESYLESMSVSEILKEPYSGEKFPGYENINHDFSELIRIFSREDPSWRTALENVKGVYVIMDKSNGKKYIGSAYGDSGIWSRWGEYMDSSGHGWNAKLMELIKQKGDGYAADNFIISLLEYRSMKTDDQVIIDREQHWKKVFLSQDERYGYNKN
ncbi:MAG: GIY-YIG nuclease family protein [bacterium]